MLPWRTCSRRAWAIRPLQRTPSRCSPGDHTSGLPRLPANLAPAAEDDPYADYTAERLYAELPRTRLQSTPGRQYLYSNLGAGLLGELLATRAGTTYVERVNALVASPLQMSRTGEGLPADNVARGYDADGLAVSYWRFDALAGGGSLRSTARDLLRFARANLTPPEGPLGDALRLAQRVHSDPPTRMGLGWHVGLGGAGSHVLWHNGGTGGFSSFLALDVARGHGVVVLANTFNPQTDAVGVELLKLLRGEPAALELPPVVEVDDATLASYEGSYALSSTFVITVTRDGARLYAQATGQTRLRKNCLPTAAPGRQSRVAEKIHRERRWTARARSSSEGVAADPVRRRAAAESRFLFVVAPVFALRLQRAALGVELDELGGREDGLVAREVAVPLPVVEVALVRRGIHGGR